MKSYNLNPTGNVWERLTACWFLLRYPQAFLDGVISAFTEQLVHYTAHLASSVVLPASTPPSDLTQVAQVAREEAANG